MKKLHFFALCLSLCALCAVLCLATACNGGQANTETSPEATNAETETVDKTEPASTEAPTEPVTDTPTEPETETEADTEPPMPENAFRITDGGASDYTIVVGADCDPAELTAATELQKYIVAMTGVTLPLVRDSEQAPADRELVVGVTNRTVAETYPKQDSFRIRADEATGCVYICGGSPRGTLYAAYGLLEQFGCRYFAVDVETVPTYETLLLHPRTMIEKTPAFDYRDVYWACAFDPALSAKLGLNASVNAGLGRYMTPELGGGISYAEYLVHSLMHVIHPDSFAAHPEYFGEKNGHRVCNGITQYSLCLSNPDVLALTIQNVRTWLEKHPDAGIVTVSQPDSDGTYYCTCPACQAVMDEEGGTPAGPLLRFVNAVADAIAEDYPHVFVDTLAYHETVVPPTHTKARDNVVVRFCLSNGCIIHAYNDPACKDNQPLRESIMAWKEVCPRLYVWDYNSNYTHYLCPKPNFNYLQQNAQFFYENNVVGCFYQGIYNEPNGKNGEFGELRTYILSKLMWDPYADIDALTDEFLLAYYGPEGGFIKEYIQQMCSIIKPRDYIRVNVEPIFIKRAFTRSNIDMYTEGWEKLKAAAGDDTAMLERIQRSELQFRYIKAANHVGMTSAEVDREWTAIVADCQRLGVTLYNEATPIENGRVR